MTCLCAMPSDSTSSARYASYYTPSLHQVHSCSAKLERILYQLYTISFFLSPSLLSYLCRTMFQFQFARPRDIDPRLSLRFWFILILLFNVGSIWSHATEGAAAGRSIVLDFVGPGPCTLLSLVVTTPHRVNGI